MRINIKNKYILIRKGFPKIYQYQKDGNNYFLVDGRSKTWGLNIRKNFNMRADAFNYAQEIDDQIKENGKSVSNNLIYQNKDIERLDTKLKPFGKSLTQAVDFYIRFMQEDMKKSIVPVIKDLCLKWYESKRDSKKKPLKPKTKSELKMYWKFITEKWGEFKPQEVSNEMIDSVLEGINCGESNVTRKQYYRYIRMFFRWCVKHKYIKEDPTDSIERITVVRRGIQILSPDEIERLLRLVELKYPTLLGYYCLTIFGGLRPSEAERAEWTDMNFECKEVYVKELGKTGSRRFVLKDTEALWVWLNHIKIKFPDKPLNPIENHIGLQKKVRLEFGDWIQDGLRHSFGTYYHNLRRDIPEVVYVMGNSVGIAKKHYVREVTKEWMEKFWSLKPTP